MFENPRTGRQARNFTTNVPKILDLDQSFPKIDVGWPPEIMELTVNNKLKSKAFLCGYYRRPLGLIVLPFEIKKASLALRIESLLENILE